MTYSIVTDGIYIRSNQKIPVYRQSLNLKFDEKKELSKKIVKNLGCSSCKYLTRNKFCYMFHYTLVDLNNDKPLNIRGKQCYPSEMKEGCILKEKVCD